MSVFRRSGSNRAERRGTPADFLVVGLGNPGAEYEGTRHNVGADAVTALAERCGERLRSGKDDALSGLARVGEQRAALAVPLTYMNESGRAVRPLVRRHGIDDVQRLLIVHDELDLEPGVLRVKIGGGLAGHNGLRSIKEHLHTTDFIRLRMGIGRPPSKAAGAKYVLRKPTSAAKAELDVMIEAAADAIESVIVDGVDEAMNRVNRR